MYIFEEYMQGITLLNNKIMLVCLQLAEIDRGPEGKVISQSSRQEATILLDDVNNGTFLHFEEIFAA